MNFKLASLALVSLATLLKSALASQSFRGYQSHDDVTEDFHDVMPLRNLQIMEVVGMSMPLLTNSPTVPVAGSAPTLQPTPAPVTAAPETVPAPAPTPDNIPDMSISQLLSCTGNIATSWGDPHMITFDDLRYDCQGDGEFVLFQSQNIDVRAIFASFPSRPVSLTTGVATSERSDAPVVEVLANSEASLSVGSCPVQVLVDGEPQILDDSFEAGDGTVTVTAYPSLKSIQVVYPRTGLIVTIEIINSSFWGCYLNAYVCTASSVTDGVGLLGNPNGSATDDWMDEAGGTLTLPTDNLGLVGQAAYDYCTTNWCIREANDSLFTFDERDGVSFADLENCDAPFPGLVDVSGASEQLMSICNDDIQCLIDGVLGGTEAAEAAVQVNNNIYGGPKQLLNIVGSNAPIGEPDPYAEGSIDGGITWGPAYAVGENPWNNNCGENLSSSWMNVFPNQQQFSDSSFIRFRFMMPPTFENVKIRMKIQADNQADIFLNDNYVDSVAGTPCTFVGQGASMFVKSGENELKFKLIEYHPGTPHAVQFNIIIEFNSEMNATLIGGPEQLTPSPVVASSSPTFSP